MKKLVVLAFFVVVVFAGSAAVTEKGNKVVIGEWKYEVPTAPAGYEKGIIVFNEKEGKLAGEVKFADGYKVELKNISYSNDTLKMGLYIDYEYISLEAKIEEKTLTGKVNSPEGPMKIIAEKIK